MMILISLIHFIYLFVFSLFYCFCFCWYYFIYISGIKKTLKRNNMTGWSKRSISSFCCNKVACKKRDFPYVIRMLYMMRYCDTVFSVIRLKLCSFTKFTIFLQLNFCCIIIFFLRLKFKKKSKQTNNKNSIVRSRNKKTHHKRF